METLRWDTLRQTPGHWWKWEWIASGCWSPGFCGWSLWHLAVGRDTHTKYPTKCRPNSGNFSGFFIIMTWTPAILPSSASYTEIYRKLKSSKQTIFMCNNFKGWPCQSRALLKELKMWMSFIYDVWLWWLWWYWLYPILHNRTGTRAANDRFSKQL